MKVAITGARGFIGGHLSERLLAAGHEVVGIGRRVASPKPSAVVPGRASVVPMGLDDPGALAEAFSGCDAVAHCAGVNRERGSDTYHRAHIEATRNVVEAARRARVRRIALTSFLRARPDCGSDYHKSKWEAEEIVRRSGLDYTVLKCGVVYGRGDHLLDHLSHALHTFPLFGLVRGNEQPVRPVAVGDLARIIEASLVHGELSGTTVAVVGPTELSLREAVLAVGSAVGRRPRFVALPQSWHYVLAWFTERMMTVPLISLAQVRILSEGVTRAWGDVTPLPAHLRPTTPFDERSIHAGLPPAGRFGWRDCRCLSRCLAACH